MTLQYRCYLYDPTIPAPERPVQAFFSDRKQAELWADVTLNKAGDGSEVWLYEIRETLEGHWPKPMKGKKDAVE